MQFHETVYGKRFFEVQLPKLTAAINRLAEAIEHQNQQDENSSKENEKSFMNICNVSADLLF